MKTMLKPLEEQVMVITGASSGIGLMTAILAAARGAKVVLVARSANALDEIHSELLEGGADVMTAVADVAEPGALERIAATVAERYGRIDTWINNAGITVYGRLEEVSDEDHRRLFETNFWGTVYGSRAALPYLRRNGGALINVGSEASEAYLPFQGMYVASKHAVKGFTDTLRIEVELDDRAPVQVVLIQPTAVDTPYPQHAANYMEEEPRLPTPMLDPEEVSQAILHAAEKGGRDVKVGAMAHMNTATVRLAPRLADRLALIQGRRQQRDEPAQDRAGALHRPSEDPRIHGRGP